MSTPEIFEPEFTKIADNISGAEGPVFDKYGQFYMVAPEVMNGDQNAGQILKINLSNGQKTVLCEPKDGSRGGVPAGCQCDRDNNIWIADMTLGLLKMDSTGKYQQMFKTDKDGRTMQGCNDCIFDYDGNLWITAPAGDIAPAPYTRSMEEPFGSVYCLTKDQKLVRIDGNLRFPNGIAVLHTADGKPSKLIVAETPTKLLWQYDIFGPGKVGSRSIWGKLPGTHEGGPDGMDFDSENNLLVANWGSGHVEVFPESGGEPITRIKLPSRCPSNLHFLPGTNTVYITEHQYHGLWKFDWKNPGKKQYCEGNNGPDGMDFDVDNNLLVTNQRAGSIEVFSQAGGSPITTIKCPFYRPSNVHFKPGTNTVYVTEHEFHGLWKFDWKKPGKKQYCEI